MDYVPQTDRFTHDYVHSYLGVGAPVVWSAVAMYDFLVTVMYTWFWTLRNEY